MTYCVCCVSMSLVVTNAVKAQNERRSLLSIQYFGAPEPKYCRFEFLYKDVILEHLGVCGS